MRYAIGTILGLFLMTSNAYADFVTGLIVGSAISSHNEVRKVIQTSGKPCMVRVKISGGYQELNAQYFVRTEEAVFNDTSRVVGVKKGLIFDDVQYEQVKGARIFMSDGTVFRTLSTQHELAARVNAMCGRNEYSP